MAMSWAELERLVGDAEKDGELRQILKASQSQADLLLAARTRGYHITRVDLQRAWQDHANGLPRRVSGG
jgi:hypothetical protein